MRFCLTLSIPTSYQVLTVNKRSQVNILRGNDRRHVTRTLKLLLNRGTDLRVEEGSLDRVCRFSVCVVF
jgi:hypothetical protein